MPKRYFKAEKETESHIKTLRAGAVLLFFIIIAALYALSQMPKEILLYDAPKLESGSTRTIQDVPVYSIYSQALYIWQAINSTDNLEDDYPKNVNIAYSAYIQPEFRQQLMDNFARETSSKTNINRKVTEMKGVKWTDNNRVVQLSDKKWVVYLDVNMIERLDDQVVRDQNFRYPIIVERVDFDPVKNPTGLELVGYYGSVKRLRANN
nr:TIGR03746 family integrating conjugative element protein [Vibrio sp. S11_S32]